LGYAQTGGCVYTSLTPYPLPRKGDKGGQRVPLVQGKNPEGRPGRGM